MNFKKLLRFIKINFSISSLLIPYLFITTKAFAQCPNPNDVPTGLGCIPTEPRDLANWFFLTTSGVASGIAFLLLIIGGIKYLTSGGDIKAVAEAQKTITSALVGFLVIILSVVILATVGGPTILDIPQWGTEFFSP